MLKLVMIIVSFVNLKLSADTLKQGDMLLIGMMTDEQVITSVEYMGQPVPLVNINSCLTAIIGTSYNTPPGHKSLVIRFSDGWNEKKVIDTSILVVKREFRKSYITFPESKQSAIDTSNERRKEEEFKIVSEAISLPSVGFYGIAPIEMPCEKTISGTYGDERWSNGKKLWNHAGVDFAVVEGTPIIAPCSGAIIMARDTFIRQGTFVILDHGAGLKSVYMHMSKRVVDEGMVAKAGDTLGFVGATGLATGPHLHMSLYVRGAPVDPLFWLERKEIF